MIGMDSRLPGGVSSSQAAPSFGSRRVRRSQSFGQSTQLNQNPTAQSLANLSFTHTKNMGLFKNMNKVELQQKLHDTLCEKDKINEKMTQAIREKLTSENKMNDLESEVCILREKLYDFCDKARK